MPSTPDVSSKEVPFSPWFFGLGLWWVWFPVFGLRIYLSPTGLQDRVAFFDGIWVLGIALLVLSLVLLVVFKRQITPLCTHSRYLVVSALMMSCGAAASGACAQGLLPAPVAFASTVVASLGAAPLMMSWGELLSVLGTFKATLSIVGSILLVGIAIFILALLGEVSPWLSIVIPVLAPLASLVAIFRSWRVAQGMKQRVLDLGTASFNVPIKTYAGLIIYGVSVGFMLSIGVSSVGTHVQLSTLVFGIGIILSTLPLLFLLYFFAPRMDFATLYRLVLPIIACILLLLMSLGTSFDETMIAFVVSLGWGYQLILSIATSAYVSNRMPVSGLMAFAKMSAPHIAGMVLGMSLWLLYTWGGLQSAMSLSMLFLMVVIALILAGVFLLNEPASAAAWGVAEYRDEEGKNGIIKQTEERARQIAQHSNLTPREQEILVLLAKGRNADYIQQELVISVHTARTHIKHIHIKLQVHSQQELLDLIEKG